MDKKSWFIPLDKSPKYCLFHLGMTFTNQCIAQCLVMLDFIPLPGSVDACRSLDHNHIWYPIVHSLQFPSPASIHTPHQASVDTTVDTTMCGRTSSFPFPWSADDKEIGQSVRKNSHKPRKRYFSFLGDSLDWTTSCLRGSPFPSLSKTKFPNC